MSDDLQPIESATVDPEASTPLTKLQEVRDHLARTIAWAEAKAAGAEGRAAEIGAELNAEMRAVVEEIRALMK